MNDQCIPQSLARIRSLNGMDDLKQLIEEWQIISQNLNKLPKSRCINLPGCLLTAHSGTGITMLLGLISRFLEETNLFEFKGDIKYLEFVMDRPENPENFSSFTRLIESIRSAAGFRGIYKGIACIDISEWIDSLHDIRFLRFLEYASDLSSNILFFFIIPLLEDKKIEEIEAVLASYLRIRRLKFDFPDCDSLFIYVLDRLKVYGFTLEESSHEILKRTLSSVRKLDSFDGYKTLNHLADDMIYEKCSHAMLQDTIIRINDLHLFLPEGPWLRQLSRNSKLRAKLGFHIDNCGEDE